MTFIFYRKGVVKVNQLAEVLGMGHSSLAVKLAERTDEVEQALRLRFRVFAEEAKNLCGYG